MLPREKSGLSLFPPNMILLLDANLSWRLKQKLARDFEQVEHVDSIGLPVPAPDFMIWDWAKEHTAVIVTNDEDYYHLLLQKGFPPKVVLLRTGNQSTNEVAVLLQRHKAQIYQLAESDEYGLIELL